MKILVVDDDRITRLLLKSFLVRSSYEVVEARTGEEAIKLFQQEHPDMVLMDVNMPVMTGYDAATVIKKISANHFVPIIFLTGLSDNESLLKCVESGGDDFLTKPIQNVLLDAKILSMKRILLMHQELEQYRQRTELEIELTQHVFDSLTKRMSENVVPGMNSWLHAAGHFSGDLMIYDTSPSGRLYLMLGDFTGHGFSAAIGAMPTSDIFFALTRRDFSLTEIIVEINRKLYEILPTGHYCAAVFVCHDPSTNHLEVFNCGLPPVFLLDDNHKTISTVESSNLALSALSSERFLPEISRFENVSKTTLVLHSDGVTEAKNNQGETFGEARLRAALEVNDSPFDSAKNKIESFIANAQLADDISLITLRFK